MAGTETDLANAALSMIREDPLTSIDDPDDARAIEAKRLWQTIVRGSVLRSADWNAVRTQANLNQVTNPRGTEWGYCYQLPADYLIARRIASMNAAVYPSRFEVLWIPFEIIGKTILTDESTVMLVYTYLETNPGVYDDLLFDACATRLAAELAYSRAGSFKLGDEKMAIFAQKVKEAEGANQVEGVGARTLYTPSGILSARRF